MGDHASNGGRLRQVYGFDDPGEVRDYYDEWAEGYDAELSANGYATPARVAQAVAGLAVGLPEGLATPVLDYGCGTGLSGEALLAAGFTTVDGADPSAEMIRVAERKRIYRSLTTLDLDEPAPPFEPGSFAVVTAIGVIGPGAAPLALFGHLLDVVAPGGLFGVSFNDMAMNVAEYPAALDETVASGRAEVVFEERGPHLPGIDVASTVFVYRRSS